MGLCHMMKSRLYMTTGNDQLSVDWEGAPKHFPKPNLYQKMVMITVWWSAAGLIQYSFLSSFFFFFPLQLSESWQNHYIWEVHSAADQWDAPKTTMTAVSIGQQKKKAQLFSTTMPDHMLYNQCFKSWINWAMKLCLIHHIHLTSCQPTTTSSSILTIFLQENASMTSGWLKMLSKNSLNPEAQIFYTTKINKLISHWQKYVDWLTKMCLSLATII